MPQWQSWRHEQGRCAQYGAPAMLAASGGPSLFYPDPGSVWIADKTCGQCHQGYADRLIKSLMNTEAGKLQGNLCSWGLLSDHKVTLGNYDLIDEDGPGLDHAAVQPHTAGRPVRDCESCHANPKTLGYGIEDGRFLKGYEKGFVIDLETATGEIIPASARPQSPAVPGLTHDLSQIVTRDNKQLVSVGSHWELTGPLPAKMERTGLCMGCHQNMLKEDLWNKVSTPGWLDNEPRRDVMNEFLHSAAESKQDD